ncbi:hypothetical protein PUN28_018014 [Cardiocondyla obscurior]|uniref:Transcriptional regulator ATRX n=1 Tax=Cardiocondyla obscurior TaxID=286306 RepID=A0AAW2EJL8_9HYME
MDIVPKKRSLKINKRILPSQRQQILKFKQMQKSLVVLCDKEDGNNSAETSFVSTRNKQQIDKSVKRINSDSESDESGTNKALSTSKKTSKNTSLRNVKTNNRNVKSKNKIESFCNSTSESEDEKCDEQDRKKNRVMSHNNNDQQKSRKSSKRLQLSDTPLDNSDNSSSKEFQTIKLQKVRRNRYSKRQLADLEIDHTKSPIVKNSKNNYSEKHIDEQSNFTFNELIDISKDCKKICSDFQMHFETIEQLYSKKDKEQFALKFTEAMTKLMTKLEQKQKKLPISNKKKNSVANNVSSDDEESSEKCEKRMTDENKSSNKRYENKAVSECDSDEIFSANEMEKLENEIPVTQRKPDKSRIENSVNNDGSDTDSEDRTSMQDKSKSTSDLDIQDDLTSSPVLSVPKEKKTSIERLNKKKLFSNSMKTKIEASPGRNHCKTLEDIEGNQSNIETVIDESMDLFDTSLEDTQENKQEVEEEEENLSNQDKQKRIESPIIKNKSTKKSQNTNINKHKSLDEEEILAKEALLATDSDVSDIIPLEENVAKLTENFVANNTNPIKKQNKNVNDSNSINDETELKNDNDQLKKNCKKISSLDENAEIERASKKALLESNSDDSTSSSELELEKPSDKKSESGSSTKNIKAKLSLLASSSESSSSEITVSEMANVSPNMKRIHQSDSDINSTDSKVKKKKLDLSKNIYYKKDKKLRMFCKVHVTRLNANDLKRYLHALNTSRKYLEHKQLESLINLDNLEKKHKKSTKESSDSLTDDDSSSNILTNPNKRKEKPKDKVESLMDHLEKIENGNISTIINTDSDNESNHSISKIDDPLISNEALISEANEIAKENLLNSSDENEVMANSDDNSDDQDKIENKKKSEKKSEEKSEEKTLEQDNNKKDKSDWRQDKILTMKLSSDTDSEAEKKFDKKQEKIANKLKENNTDSDNKEKPVRSKKKKVGRRIIDSDSDNKITDLDSDNDGKSSSANQSSSDLESDLKKKRDKRKKRKSDNSHSSDTSSVTEIKSKPKRKRIKKMASDSDSSDVEELKNSQESSFGKGRKNIRKVLKDKQVAEDTKQAAKEEEERLKRIAERQAVYNEMYEVRLAGEEKVEKLVLDFDPETKKELVTVHPELVKCLKPHQAQGIKFMWDACFESLERAKNTSGSGCIIAHCMGLGKTLQVITLTHTLLTHEEINIKTVLIVCPLSTVLNWRNEYNTWLKDLDDFEVYELTKFKKNFERKWQLQRWRKTGGVMIIGYEMFRNLSGPKKNMRKGIKEVIIECLVDPGADLIVCDEGHLLKNEDTALSKSMRNVKTRRRIVLTGTPLQNNLTEYHCMVQFVKPNLLGTKKEFLNRFVNPITNGQFDDSTAYDVKLMKKRAHVLHKMLEGSVQRFDYSVLTPFLPPKQEYVIFVRLTDAQIKMYHYYLANLAKRLFCQRGTLFPDFQALQRIWTHPVVVRLNAEKLERANEKKELSESEGSLKDFINDDSSDVETITSSSNSNSDSDVQEIDDKNDKPSVSKRKTRNNPGDEEESPSPTGATESEWWLQFVQPEDYDDLRASSKLLILFGILKESEQIGDKVLVFSQSLYSLSLIEDFLKRIDDQTQNGEPCETLDNHTGSWSLGLDYFRLDGQTSPENRNIWCKIFNRPTNTRARLFLISTRAGGLGINLTAANRVIIFDASWNPSHDVQSIFRIFRFGQKKPCYVYRLLAAGTMEEKIYNRQVTKLSLSCRVVDEQQIERHYSNQNLNELYTFEGYNDKDKPTLNLPKDRLLAEIFLKYKDVVESYHEHDSLLENKAEEELDEEERKQAWLEYEEEKKGKPMINPMANMVYQNNMYLQQQMMMNTMQPNMMAPLQLDVDNLQHYIRQDYPNATPEQQKIMANKVIMDMYNYWEKQATLYPSTVTAPRSQVSNFQQNPQVSTSSNLHQSASQLNQLLLTKPNYMNVNKTVQPSGVQMGDVVLNTFAKNLPVINDTSKNTTTDQDIQIIPTTSNTGVTRQSGISSAQVTPQPIDKSKMQEE